MEASKSNNYGYNKNLRSKANALRKNMTKAEVCLWKYALRAGGVQDSLLLEGKDLYSTR